MLISGRNYSLDSRIDLEIPVINEDHGRLKSLLLARVAVAILHNSGTFVIAYQVLLALTSQEA